ncbi:hypothetical protein AAG906_013528 [Vitis piasezkii]
MSADHLQFLKNKFILDLEDAVEEHSGKNEIPLLSLFLQIRDIEELSIQRHQGIRRLRGVVGEARTPKEEGWSDAWIHSGGALAYMHNQKVAGSNKEKADCYS